MNPSNPEKPVPTGDEPPSSPPLEETPSAPTASPSPPAPEPAPASASAPASEETALLYELVGDAHLLTVVVLVGASALVPVPFLDDVAKGYLERRMLRSIAEREKMTLSSQEIDHLTKEPPDGCCLMGCLGNVVLYPLKRILRKVLFFLEIKRSMDQSSTALAEAWLFSLALRRGLWSPGRDISEADRLRQVIETSCQSQGVKPLETALGHAFQGAKDVMSDVARRFVGKKVEDKAQMDAALRKFEAEEGEQLSRLSKRLREALGEVGEVYLQRFAREFERQLEVASKKPPGM